MRLCDERYYSLGRLSSASLFLVKDRLKQFLQDYEVEYPLDCFDLIQKIKISGKIDLDVETTDRLSRSFDATAVYLPEIDGYLIIMKPVPDNWKQYSSWRRCNFTLAHELGHIFCGHLTVPKNMKSKEQQQMEDDEADEFRSDFAFEEDDEGSFFMRHLRGIVGLALFVILLLMFVIFAFSRAGQVSLARVNAAWSKDAYSTLGYQYYQAGDYSQAGLYYERALQRDPNSYSFASSAAMAYLEAGENEKAAAMLKRCAEIDPTKLEPYVYLLRIYPDASSRPWDITQLLQQGYQRTGDARLNVTG